MRVGETKWGAGLNGAYGSVVGEWPCRVASGAGTIKHR